MNDSYQIIGSDIFDDSGKKIGKMLTENELERMYSFADIREALARGNEIIARQNKVLAQVVVTNQQVLQTLKTEVPAGIEANNRSLEKLAQWCHLLGVIHAHAQVVLHGELNIYQQKTQAKRQGLTYKVS